MQSKLKLHYNEGCINVIANEAIYWEGEAKKELKGKISVQYLPKPARFIYTSNDASGIISLFTDRK